jgi:hypothetical protein
MLLAVDPAACTACIPAPKVVRAGWPDHFWDTLPLSLFTPWQSTPVCGCSMVQVGDHSWHACMAQHHPSICPGVTPLAAHTPPGPLPC